eukprot:3507231-Pleurochrysis_carterae.AAC.4
MAKDSGRLRADNGAAHPRQQPVVRARPNVEAKGTAQARATAQARNSRDLRTRRMPSELHA